MTIAILLLAGIVVGIVAVIVTAVVAIDHNIAEATSGRINVNVTERTNVTVIVGEPIQRPVLSDNGTWITTYLPVNFTQTIRLFESTHNMTLYPIFERWDGLVRTDALQASLFDENNNTVATEGFVGSTADLRFVNATCIEPYFVTVNNTGGDENGGIKFKNTTKPASSEIIWGGPDFKNFAQPQSGIIHYEKSGYGIVPACYNDDYDKFFKNNGAGNQKATGTYHLNFVSFYPAIVNLPEQANMTSFLEVKCTVNESDDHYVETSRLPHIYVYDVWFKIGSKSSPSSFDELPIMTIPIGSEGQLLQKLNEAQDAIGQLYVNQTITPEELSLAAWSVDERNLTLDVVIDDRKATLSKEAYAVKLKELLGRDIPIKVSFGRYTPLSDRGN